MAQWRNCPQHGQYSGHGACPYGCPSEFNRPGPEPDPVEAAVLAVAKAAAAIAKLVKKPRDEE